MNTQKIIKTAMLAALASAPLFAATSPDSVCAASRRRDLPLRLCPFRQQLRPARRPDADLS